MDSAGRRENHAQGHASLRRPADAKRVDALNVLTPFERRLLHFFADGMSRAEIAYSVNRSPQTVSHVLTMAKEKIGAKSLAHAAVLVMVAELISEIPPPG